MPGRKKQFRNFTSNSLKLRGRNEAIVEQIWNVSKEKREKWKAEQEAIREQRQKEKEEEPKLKEESKPKKTQESDDDDISDDDEEGTNNNLSAPKTTKTKSDNNSSIDPKKVKKATKKALEKAPNRSMKIKDLRLLDQE
jgi:hypothetical protein